MILNQEPHGNAECQHFGVSLQPWTWIILTCIPFKVFYALETGGKQKHFVAVDSSNRILVDSFFSTQLREQICNNYRTSCCKPFTVGDLWILCGIDLARLDKLSQYSYPDRWKSKIRTLKSGIYTCVLSLWGTSISIYMHIYGPGRMFLCGCSQVPLAKCSTFELGAEQRWQAILNEATLRTNRSS